MNHLLLSRRMALLVALSLTAAGCELIGDIFQAGLVVGFIIILLILAMVGWVIGKFRGRG
jgi:hypothetical protein